MAKLSDLHDNVFHVEAARADKLSEKGKSEGAGTISEACETWRKKARVCRDLLEEEVTGYISQWEGESDTEYATRKKNSIYSFVNWYEEAAYGLIDQAFSKDVQLDDAPPSVEAFFQNVERRKRAPIDFTQFMRRSARFELGYGGNPLILIDHTARVDASDRAEEEAQSPGPFFCLIHPWAVIDAYEDEDGNLEAVRYVANRSKRTEDGFDSERELRIIELLRGPEGGFSMRRVYVWSEKTKEYVRDDTQERAFDPGNVSPEIKRRFRDIPIVELADWWSAPKLRNVAMLNILHLRKRVDFEVAESISSIPMWLALGFTDDEMQVMEVGSYRIAHTPKAPGDADIKDISFGFETAQTSLKTLESIERYIATKSKDPQSQRATGEEKSTIRMLDEAKKISRLQAWALRWLAAGQAAHNWAGWWMGEEDAGRVYYLPEVFEALSVEPTWTEFSAFHRDLIDSPPELWEWMIDEAKRYGLIADDKPTDELTAMLAAANAGGGLDADGE